MLISMDTKLFRAPGTVNIMVANSFGFTVCDAYACLHLLLYVLDSETAAATLNKWFRQQHGPNSTDGLKGLEMMSVEELEQNETD